jgi:hypothetical protein
MAMAFWRPAARAASASSSAQFSIHPACDRLPDGVVVRVIDVPTERLGDMRQLIAVEPIQARGDVTVDVIGLSLAVRRCDWRRRARALEDWLCGQRSPRVSHRVLETRHSELSLMCVCGHGFDPRP